jgi:predicted nucleic acid-binding protein
VIVVDTSVLIDFYLDASSRTAATARRVLGADIEWYAPSHQPVEFLNSLRGLTLGKKVEVATAEVARKLYGLQTIARTTGAGDAFCGATASALASGHSLEVAVKRANRFAADSTTRRRALDSHVVERERSEDCSPATCQ